MNGKMISARREINLRTCYWGLILVLDADERILIEIVRRIFKGNKGLAYKLTIYNVFNKNSFTVSFL